MATQVTSAAGNVKSSFFSSDFLKRFISHFVVDSI